MPTTNAVTVPQTKSRKGGRLRSRLLLCGTAAMILLAQATPSSGQTALPSEIEHACADQVAYLYQNRSRLGITSVTGEGGGISQFSQLDLLPHVKPILKKYERWRP